jgi:hypothetical protein
MSEEEQRVFTCPHCEKAALAKVCGQAFWSGLNRDGEPVNPPEEWSLVQCKNCALPSLQLREDYGGGFEEDEPIFLYPNPPRLSPNVPYDLRKEWEEAQICFKAKAYAACSVMARRTLEGTCIELGVNKGSLAKSLKELQKKGLIDGMLAEWADALRIAGNKGAHFTGEPVSREDAEDALAFTEALLDHVYVLRKRFEEFQGRLNRRQKN